LQQRLIDARVASVSPTMEASVSASTPSRRAQGASAGTRSAGRRSDHRIIGGGKKKKLLIIHPAKDYVYRARAAPRR
jgi:hypothetical protein